MKTVANGQMPNRKPNIDDLFRIADEAGVRLEIIDGLPVWEALPNLIHQESVDRIRQTVKPGDHRSGGGCACLHYSDLHIKFPDGSDKRPEISIFCHRPAETESAVTEVPEAVVEVLSKGYEKKDLELGPPFYRFDDQGGPAIEANTLGIEQQNGSKKSSVG